MQDNKQDMTIAKTLWSETIIDALLAGLQEKATDEKIKELNPINQKINNTA